MSVAVKRYVNFIDGQSVESASGETDEIVNPANGEVIAEVPRSSGDDVDRAVAAAEKAFFGDWRDTTPAERFALIGKLADAIEEHRDELGQLESLNVGKPLEAAKEEMDASADCFRFMAGAARTPEGQAAAEYVRHLSEPGALTVADDGRIGLAPAAGGKHRTLSADTAQKDRILQIYAEMASTKPVGRAQRFRPPQKKQ